MHQLCFDKMHGIHGLLLAELGLLYHVLSAFYHRHAE